MLVQAYVVYVMRMGMDPNQFRLVRVRARYKAQLGYCVLLGPIRLACPFFSMRSFLLF